MCPEMQQPKSEHIATSSYSHYRQNVNALKRVVCFEPIVEPYFQAVFSISVLANGLRADVRGVTTNFTSGHFIYYHCVARNRIISDGMGIADPVEQRPRPAGIILSVSRKW